MELEVTGKLCHNNNDSVTAVVADAKKKHVKIFF